MFWATKSSLIVYELVSGCHSHSDVRLIRHHFQEQCVTVYSAINLSMDTATDPPWVLSGLDRLGGRS
jgi:hypothetical protein